MVGEALQGGLVCRSVRALVVVGGDPSVDLLVERIQGASLNGREKLAPNGLKEALYLAAPLGLVGLGMDEGDSKGGRDLVEEFGSKGGTVVHVELAGKSPLQESASQGTQIGIEILVQVKGGMGNEPTHVVDEGKQIGLAALVTHQDHGAVHGVALPQVVGEFGFELAPIDGRGRCHLEEPFPLEEPVEGAWARIKPGGRSFLFSSSEIRVGREHRGISVLRRTMSALVSSSMTRLMPRSLRLSG